jgi:hypothetical protein
VKPSSNKSLMSNRSLLLCMLLAMGCATMQASSNGPLMSARPLLLAFIVVVTRSPVAIEDYGPLIHRRIIVVKSLSSVVTVLHVFFELGSSPAPAPSKEKQLFVALLQIN